MTHSQTSVPVTAAATSSPPSSQYRVFASGTNLWTLTAYSGPDPEVSTLDGSTTAQGIDFFTLPQVKTMLVGITVKF